MTGEKADRIGDRLAEIDRAITEFKMEQFAEEKLQCFVARILRMQYDLMVVLEDRLNR